MFFLKVVLCCLSRPFWFSASCVYVKFSAGSPPVVPSSATTVISLIWFNGTNTVAASISKDCKTISGSLFTILVPNTLNLGLTNPPSNSCCLCGDTSELYTFGKITVLPIFKLGSNVPPKTVLFTSLPS